MTFSLNIEKKKKSDIDKHDLDNLPFGRIFSDHMLIADYEDGKWKAPSIMPYQDLKLSPAISGLHYGQSVFEGLKAYKTAADKPVLFRPHDNYNRMNKSAERLCMPEIPEEIFIDGLKELVRLDKDWIPKKEGSALYIRPFMFACDKYIGIKPSDNYKFVIFTCPVGPYYPEPVKVKIEQSYVRACKGGVGAAKAAGNYGAALYPTALAQKEGYHQLLWTDAQNFSYIEESGTMNIFFVINGVVITPQTSGTILEGITRSSIIQLLKKENYRVEERNITVDEVVKAWQDKSLEEAFGAGTAATIAHISHIGKDDQVMELPPVKDRKVSNMIFDKLESIKTGRAEDTFGWLEYI